MCGALAGEIINKANENLKKGIITNNNNKFYGQQKKEKEKGLSS